MNGFFDAYDHQIIPEPNSGCWLWIGAATPVGYGVVRQKQKCLYTHRLAFEAARGQGAADGLVVRHRCDTPSCVNPDHLEIGTHLDNSNDKYARGRGNTGERCGTAKLTEDQVLEIVEASRNGARYADLARQYGVTKEAVSLICRGLRWSSITKIGEAHAV